MTDEWVSGWRPSGNRAVAYDTSTKVNPPLRSEADRQSLIAAVRDGTLDLIGTDHAPHAEVDKDCEYGSAAFGISGLETALASLLGLVRYGDLDLGLLIQRMTTDPARAFGLDTGSLRPGKEADVCIFDQDASWLVETRDFASKGKNTPLAGERLRGRVVATICRGEVVFIHDSARARTKGEGVPA
jgi:dihydroorotase